MNNKDSRNAGGGASDAETKTDSDALSAIVDKMTAAMDQQSKNFLQALENQHESLMAMLERVAKANTSAPGSAVALAGDRADRPIGTLAGFEGDVLVFDPSAIIAIEPETNPHNNKLSSRIHFYGGGSTRVAEAPGEVAHVLNLA